jgi:hypothetical protein
VKEGEGSGSEVVFSDVRGARGLASRHDKPSRITPRDVPGVQARSVDPPGVHAHQDAIVRGSQAMRVPRGGFSRQSVPATTGFRAGFRIHESIAGLGPFQGDPGGIRSHGVDKTAIHLARFMLQATDFDLDA